MLYNSGCQQHLKASANKLETAAVMMGFAMTLEFFQGRTQVLNRAMLHPETFRFGSGKQRWSERW